MTAPHIEALLVEICEQTGILPTRVAHGSRGQQTRLDWHFAGYSGETTLCEINYRNIVDPVRSPRAVSKICWVCESRLRREEPDIDIPALMARANGLIATHRVERLVRS